MESKKMTLLELSEVENLLAELAYARITLEQEVKPMAEALIKINKDIENNIENIDSVIASKMEDMIGNIDLELIQRIIIKQILKKFDGDIRNINDLSKLTTKVTKVVEKFHGNYSEIDKILNAYDNRIKSTKLVSKMNNFLGITLAFGIGGTFYPFLHWYFVIYLG